MTPSTSNATAGETWALVLAGGDGTRLRCLTDDGAGNAVPKQFCSLDGGNSLVGQTLARARSIAAPERIASIVSAPHRRFWGESFRNLAPENLVVQPFNRGTGVGILLPALRIYSRDPDAQVVILPSDHYVADEAVLEDAIRAALRCIGEHGCGVALLGIEPDEPDPELGYILGGPAVAESPLRSIRRFVEKPPLDEARHLWREGALWNSFIIVCRVASLIELYRSRCTEVVEVLERIGSEGVRNCRDRWTERLAQVYQHLRAVDFSQQIAAAQVERLTVMPVAPCGWTDLGTPQRLAKTLARHPRAPVRTCPGPPRVVDVRVNLAERLLATARTGT